MRLRLPRLKTKAPTADLGPGAEGRAERLLAEYLRQWGLREPSAIALQCRRWVRQVTEDQRNRRGADGAENDLSRAALMHAMNDTDRWIDHLARQVSPDAMESAGRRGLLAMEIKRVIDSYPATFLQYESLPESFLQRLGEEAGLVVPAATQLTRMQGPKLGELPPLFQWKTWRRLADGAAMAVLTLIGLRRNR